MPRHNSQGASLAAIATSFALILSLAHAPSCMAQAAQQAPPSAGDMDKLVAPIALYPDALIAQMLLCAQSPYQVKQVDAWMKAHATLKGSEAQAAAQKEGFDASFVALVLFPQVMDMMAKQPDWTTKLGQAFTTNKNAVFDSIQRLRAQAKSMGNLQTTQQQEVVTQTTSSGQQVIIIQPANPQIVYVPVYNTTTVYTQPAPAPTATNTQVASAAVVGFAAGVIVGAAAADDDDYYGWGYHGGACYGEGWDNYTDYRENRAEAAAGPAGAGGAGAGAGRAGVGGQAGVGGGAAGQAGAGGGAAGAGRAGAGGQAGAGGGAAGAAGAGGGATGGAGAGRTGAGGQAGAGGGSRSGAGGGGYQSGSATRSASSRGNSSLSSRSGGGRGGGGGGGRGGGGGGRGGGGGGGRSDVNLKDNFAAVDPQATLEKVAALPITTWSYKDDTASRHVGPMAQDFYRAFGVGTDDKTITFLDEGGVALSAIQGLNQKIDEKDARIQAIEKELAELKAQVQKLAAPSRNATGSGN